MRDVYADTPGSDRYAGFWIRVFANVLDVLLLAADQPGARCSPPAAGACSAVAAGDDHRCDLDSTLGSAQVFVAGVVPPS